ncbi:hypothetical protein BRC96_08955 [Halobacteriales archaeon QS_6_64_34]|nr:MAG: hypothetical protein BRC96_08955 [Halobacteriales archaeon QS_6_64_34]
MDEEIYEREDIAEMSGERLRELFGEGYPSGSWAYYDGEKVLSPPTFGETGDPEVVEWIHEPDDGDEHTEE